MSDERKKSVIDLMILMGLPFMVIFLVLPNFISLAQDMDVIKFYCIGAIFQFITVGLGAILIMLIRKENLAHYGVVKKNALKSILLTPLAYIPQIILTLSMRKDFVYRPFQYVINPKLLSSLSLFKRIIAYLIIIIVWEILEVFTYIVISDKINKIFKSKNLFLNPGAILTAVFVVLIHALVGGNSWMVR